jgi:enamine deaminase RidA (YjgF/YER057c/UK114 family)
MMPTLIKAITAKSAPQPFGRYLQAMEAAAIVFVSDQLAICSDSGSLADGPFEVQAPQAITNLIAIIEGAGLGRERIAKITAISSASNTGWRLTRSTPRFSGSPSSPIGAASSGTTPCRLDRIRGRRRAVNSA